MAQFSYELKIPKDRVGALIGKNGETKKLIEGSANIELIVDSKEGDIFFSGDDPLALFSVKDVLKAIGRGFNPETALLILKQDYLFELIDISDFARSKNDIGRIKGRVIGSNGKSREHIEELTDTNISVYGKTIGIIGRQEDVISAHKAIDMLLNGSPHSNVYNWLERMRRRTKDSQFMGL